MDGEESRLSVRSRRDGAIACLDVVQDVCVFVGMRDRQLGEVYSLNLNTGEELRLSSLNNEFTAEVHIYTQTTTKLLMNSVGLPSSSGFQNLSVTNTGEMRNNGWEFNINGTDVVKVGKFSMGFNVSFANNRNEITEMDPTVLAGLNKEFNSQNGSYLARVQLNNAYGSIYGFRYKGVYQYTDYSEVEVPGVSGPNAPVARDANGDVIRDKNGFTVPMVFGYDKVTGREIYEFQGGDAIYEDINHDGNINELDIVYLGSSLPKITGGWGLRLNYGRWSLNAQFNFRAGNKVVNAAPCARTTTRRLPSTGVGAWKARLPRFRVRCTMPVTTTWVATASWRMLRSCV